MGIFNIDSRGGISNIIPPITLNLMIINLIMWLATDALQRFGIDLVEIMGLHYFQANAFNPLQLFSYMFLHANFTHLFFNMFSLWMFGRIIEQYWGYKRYLIYYITCGLAAAVVQEIVWAFDFMSLANSAHDFMQMSNGTLISKAQLLNMPVTIGASGAVFGLLLAFGVLFPNAPIFLMFIPIPIKAKYFVIFYGLVELFLGVAPTEADSNVAHFAHLGGMLGGIILILFWRKRGSIHGPHL